MPDVCHNVVMVFINITKPPMKWRKTLTGHSLCIRCYSKHFTWHEARVWVVRGEADKTAGDRMMKCSECCTNRPGLCPTGRGEWVLARWDLQLKKIPQLAVWGTGRRRWDGKQRGELGNCFNSSDKWKLQGGGMRERILSKKRALEPPRPAPQPWGGKEEGTGS